MSIKNELLPYMEYYSAIKRHEGLTTCYMDES
jgi:hypothetical protein